MRVLFTSVPQAGHLFPLLPLARAFAGQGDDVLVATARTATAEAERAGLPVAAVGAEYETWWPRLFDRTRGRPGDGLPPERVLRYFVPRLFAEIGADLTVDDLHELARRWRPDLIVADPFAFAAPLVADLVGAAYAQHMISPALDPLTLELCADAVSPLWRAFGRDVPAYGGVYAGVTLNLCPAALEPVPAPVGADVLGIRPAERGARDGSGPDVLSGWTGRPIVYVTLGTFSNTDLSVFRAVLDGLAELPVHVVVTVGTGNDPADLGAVPANARVERYVPQAQLLPYCAAVVHHAGSGTMFGALAHGLPQLALPQGADNFVNAERLLVTGAAQVLRPGEVSAAAIRDAVTDLLTDDGYGKRAGEVADQIAALPAPAEVAAELRRRHRAHGV